MSDPRDLTEAILAIGSVATGDASHIKIQGFISSVWLAAYADFVMGLRVQVESNTGEQFWMNFSETRDDAQITTVDKDMSDEGRTSISQSITRTVLVSGGQKFICQAMDLAADHQNFTGGRTNWDHVLEELYREEISDLCPTKEGVNQDNEDDALDEKHLPRSGICFGLLK